METKTLGVLVALSFVLIVVGAYLRSYSTIGTTTISGISIPTTVTWPYSIPGNILLGIGVILLIISAALLVGTLLIREAKTPSPSTRRR
jgi:hypothetical protein